MQLESANDLIHALQVSGLFTAEQFKALTRDLGATADAAAQLKHLVRTGQVTTYQLKKLIKNRAEDLFVGPYIVTDKLGEGGMGKVFRARLATGGATVALKVVRAALVANATVRGRFAREIQATGKLNHPNIVCVLDAGEADGKVYMAMEFVDGIDLARLMRDYGILEVTEACEYARQIALGLQHAHDRGFVHRDIKPSNIVVAGERHLPQATEPAVVKILDLGLARAIDPDDMVAPDLTRDHTVVGTPDYMAPEQAKNSKSVDGRADLYSLGCAMYFLLTGRVPFGGTTAIQKILAHQSEVPPPLQGLRPDVPPVVAELVAKLMAKRPEDRFQSATELVHALEPLARYPAGAAAVESIPRPANPANGSARGSSRGTESGSGRSPFPPSSLGSSVGPISPLELSRDEPTPKHAVQPVAPSDNTPRPKGLPRPTTAPASQSRKRKTRRPARRSHELSPFVWVALAVFGVGVIAILLWLANR